MLSACMALAHKKSGAQAGAPDKSDQLSRLVARARGRSRPRTVLSPSPSGQDPEIGDESGDDHSASTAIRRWTGSHGSLNQSLSSRL